MISIFKEAWSPPKTSTSVELTKLYRSLEEGLNRRPGSSVAITCARSSEQVMRLAYDLAWVGSTLLGKRVLVLDTMGQTNHKPVARAYTPPVARPVVPEPRPVVPEPRRDRAPSQALVEMDRALREPNSVGLLSLRVSPVKDAAVMPQLAEIWGKLQTTFDMILVAAPPVLDDPTAASLSGVVDGSVLVVPAGASREPEVARAIEVLTSGTTPLIGVVMTDQRHTFPRWIRWLFGKA